MASNLGYVVLEVDGQGSGGQGQALMTSIQGHLGDVEVKDQLIGVDYSLKKFSYLDPTKVAVSGVSYGGYVSTRILSSMEEKAQKFKCGIAVSPVADWRLYGKLQK